ncbi:MAG: hypothetical protein CSA62_15255 [Planctomycetota bacterium]|nr:MAG: hypothetical protein CSA62_15255 [Planctomycetota bacterium]
MAAPRRQRFLRFGLGLLTLALSAYATVQVLTTLSQGPNARRFPVHVLFKDAHGLRRGSLIRFRGMVVGDVAAIELDESSSRVRVELRLEPAIASVLSTTTEFWTVYPRFRGLRRGLYGLDTLIKESYVQMRDRPDGDALEAGAELLGRETQPDDLAEGELEDTAVGDLLATLLLPDAGSLKPGSPILFRGIQTGEVRRVQLSGDGRGVVLSFRIFASYRHTVRDESRFWLARPVLRGSLMSGFSVEELSSLLLVSLSYDMPQGCEPAEDGAQFIGLVEPPREAEDWDGESVEGQHRSGNPKPKIDPAFPRLSPRVTVRYRAIERDFWSKNDELQLEGEGVLYQGQGKKLYVLTRRSACDGEFSLESSWYDAVDIDNERIRVVLGDGRVWPARVQWKAGGAHDLAVLVVQAAAGAGSLILPPSQSYLRFDAVSAKLPSATGRSGPGSELYQENGVFFGILGRTPGEDSKPAPTGFSLVPELLRPADRRRIRLDKKKEDTPK